MKHVFEIPKPFQVPDGTLVSPFLNSKDSQSSLPFGLLDGFSIAAGRVEAGVRSKLQILPFVTQVTFVRRGSLEVLMKGMEDAEEYPLRVAADQAVLAPPETWFQLINRSRTEPCEVLYIVSPAYVFLSDQKTKRVIYDDSVVVDESWAELRSSGWQPSAEWPTKQQRDEAYRLLAGRTA